MYLSPKFSRVLFTIVHTDSIIRTMVNGTLLNFGKRCKGELRVIFDQWPKFHLGLDALSNHKISKGVLLNIPVTQDELLEFPSFYP